MSKRVTAAVGLAAMSIPAAGGVAHAAATKATAKTYTVRGPVVQMRWGPVQAVLKIKKHKIVDVKIGVGPENFRSQSIDEHAVPILHDETLQAQNDQIDLVSGATDTSGAYVQSLQAALDKAKTKKLLK